MSVELGLAQLHLSGPLGYNKLVDKNQNKKKRRSRGDGVTSYRVTSSLTLTDEAYQHQQRAKQQKAIQPDPYAQPQYPPGANQQGGYYEQQGQQGYYDQQGQQGYYDQQGGYEQQQGYEQPYDSNGYAEGYYDQQSGYEQQQGYDQQYDPNAYPVEGYYDQQGQQGYDQQYDANGYPAQGYYDQNQPGYEGQGYYDQQGQQGYEQQYDANGYPTQGYYDQQGQQGYYDQPAGYEQQQGEYDPNYYPQAGAAPQALPPRKRKIESVSDRFSEMLGEGHVFATDADDSPHHETIRNEQKFYEKQYQQMQPYPPPHLVPQSPVVQLLGPFADIFIKLMGLWKNLNQKATYYTDMMLDLQESIQKEFKEAAGQAFKGFLSQLKQRSPIALPYQQAAGAQAAQQAGLPPGYQAYGQPGPQQAPVSFVDLQELNVEFTDNYDQPLFDFSKYANSQYKVSKGIADPAASETALWAIRECASRAGAIPPAQEGPYANLPLTEVMNNITEQDLQAFLRYVKAYPGNYVSRSLKISETFATWVVYGAPQP